MAWSPVSRRVSPKGVFEALPKHPVSPKRVLQFKISRLK